MGRAGGACFPLTHRRGSGVGFIPKDFNSGVGAGWATALGRQGAVGRCVFPEPERLTGSIDRLKMDGGGGVRCDQSYRTRGHREGRGFVVGCCGGRGGQERESGEDEGGRELHVEVMRTVLFSRGLFFERR